jgi:hypothetical protein
MHKTGLPVDKVEHILVTTKSGRRGPEMSVWVTSPIADAAFVKDPLNGRRVACYSRQAWQLFAFLCPVRSIPVIESEPAARRMVLHSCMEILLPSKLTEIRSSLSCC